MKALTRSFAVASWVLLLGALALAPMLLGSTRAWAWPITTLVVMAAGLCAGVRFLAGREKARVPLAAPALLAGLVALGALQSIPLPRKVVEAVAPERARQDAAALDGLASPSASLAISVAPDLTAAWSWKWAASAVVFVVVALIVRRRKHARFLAMAMACFAGAEALFGAVGAFAHLKLSPEQSFQGRAMGTFINPNHFAALLEIGLFATLGLVFDRVRRMRVPDYPKLGARISAVMDAPDFWKVQLLLGLALVIVVGLFASLSRGALFGGVTGFVVFTMIFVMGRHKWLIVPALLVVAGVAWYAGAEQLMQRVEVMLNPGYGRSEFAVMALSIWKANPTAGAGLGAFLHSSTPYWPPDQAAQYALYAHNDYADVLAGGGAVGAALLLGFLGAVGVAVARRSTRSVSPLFIGAVAGVVAVAAHTFVEFNWHIPGVAVWFFASCGVVICPGMRARNSRNSLKVPEFSEEEKKEKRAQRGNAAVGLPLVAVAIAGAVVLVPMMQAGWAANPKAITPAPEMLETAMKERQAGRDPSALLAAALSREPMGGRAHVERALWGEQAGDVGLADECFRRAVDRDPGNLAVLRAAREWWMGRFDPAKPEAGVLRELVRTSGPVLWNAADPRGVLEETLRVTQMREVLLGLVPPEGNPGRAGWERYVSEFVAKLK